MTIICIKNRKGDILGFSRKKNPEEAANAFARRVHGRKASALRTTGTKGMSGYFQAYLPYETGGLTSEGEPFFVSD